MMTINYEKVRSDIRKLADESIRPNAAHIDESYTYPRQNLNALAKDGWNSLFLSEQDGGLGLDFVSFAIAAEEIGHACASTGLVYVMHSGAFKTIQLYGNKDQQTRWLKTARDGLVGTYSTSEKASGGHWWFNFSEASRAGSDYLINADKSFTTSSGQADYYLVQTRTPGAKGPTEISFFIVDGKTPGIKAGAWEALGVHGNHSGPISYSNVAVAEKDRLGDENQGKDIIYHGVSPVYLVGLGAVWHGVARAALEEVVQYATRTTHQDFNRSLSDYQVLRQQIGEAKVLVSSLGPWQADLARQLNVLEAEGRPQGEILLALTEFKVHAAEVANKVTRLALDISGGYGYKRGLLERLFRDARAGIAMGPSNNIAREWIGKGQVGLPLELFEAGGE
jgi:alkylation response protein AidB-like acyl-CoA dehydrogenase